jgi:hypothetical protein
MSSATRSRFAVVMAVVMLLMMAGVSHAAFSGFLKMTNGYFFDNVSGKAFVPHGVAYQTWNRPLGVWQTPEQLRYDLDEMVKMNCNAVRVDFVWQHAEEKGDNQWSWENYDLLVQECEKRDIRIFALIGYQWPPNWFPDNWYTMHPPEVDAEGIAHTNRWQSDIIGYETPEARAQYAEWISNVCARYKNSKAIAGWIVGNESGYLGLWSGLLDGYDPYCEAAFRSWCQIKYGTIAAANAKWGSTYTNFNQIVFVDQYRAYGVEGAIWADMVQWREDSIASFTAVGARAAKVADTNHLISYSTVGMQWGEEDWRYHAEDRGKITTVCLASNAPIDFFSVNNYPWSILGHESQNGHWGVSYTKKVAKVPVLYSETGFTSSETMWPGMDIYRQGPLVRNAMWESLEVGAIGTHVFSWMDRPYITDREKGFGIVYADRGIKPAYWELRNMFNLMEQVKIHDLLMGSQDPKPDIGFLWTDAADSQHNRYECEMQQIAGALERIGYEPNFLNLAELGDGTYTNFKVIILPRNMRVDDVVPNSTNKTVLDFLRTVVLPKGIHVVASADIPGVQNFHGQQRAQYVQENQALFGIDPSNLGGYEVPMRRKTFVNTETTKKLKVKFTTNAIGAVSGGYTYQPYVWKYNDEIALSTGGILWATMDPGRNKGFEDSTTNIPAWGSWWNTATTGVSSAANVQPNWGWQYSGANMLQMYGDAVIWQAQDIVPFGRYVATAYLRSNSDDPLRNGSYASLAIEWYGLSNNYLGISEAVPLTTNTPGNGWVKYVVDDIAPSNAGQMVRVIRVGHTNLLQNPGLTGSGAAPTGWQNWNDTTHDPNTVEKLGTSGNSWMFWYDGGLYQDVTTGFAPGERVNFGGWLYTPSSDPLKNGTKKGIIALEFYNGAVLISSTQAAPGVEWATIDDVWNNASGTAIVPAGCNKIRMVVQTLNPTNGSGRFFADDLYVRNVKRSGGSVYVDNAQESPAMVVKNHGAGKAAIFTYSVGDNLPDSGDDPDMEPDTHPWKYRYDIMSSLIRDYFGVQPAITVLGTNNPYCLPEYRVTSNGAYLIQIKNYLYDTAQPNGGAWQTFVIQAPMLTGKVIRAFEQGRIIEENCDGQFWISLPPDGQEMILAYNGAAPAVNPSYGSSEQRMWRGSNSRSGVSATGPSTFPLTQQWVRSVSSGACIVDGDKLFTANGTLMSCLDVHSGNILWQYSTTNHGAGINFNHRGIAAIDGTVYAVTKNNFGATGAIYAIDSATGQFKWQYRTASYGASPPVVQSNVLYFSSVDGYVRALDAQSGLLLWEVGGGSYYACPYGGMALDNGWLYFPNYGNRYLYCISATNGSYRWATYLGGYIDMTPTVVSNRVYVGNDSGGGLRCIDATTGAQYWSATNWNVYHRSVAVSGGKLYFIATPSTSSSPYYVVCMNATTYGAPIWTRQLSGTPYYNSSVVIHSNRVYAPHNYVDVFDANTGATLWQSPTYAGAWQEPCVKNGRLFVSDSSGIFAYSDGSAWPTAPAASGNTNQLVQITDAPAVVHPFGDKVFTLKVKYDCRDVVGLKLYCAFMENGNNGDALTNEIYQILTNSVVGNGEQWFFMWIPDPNKADTDYKSTPDGGKYVFQAWLANTAGVKVAQAVPQAVGLEWGVAVTNALPSSVTKGQTVTMNTEWEDLYEQLWWQNTPMARNDAYPGRVAVYRSNKTEAQFPGHLAKANEVCNWLESLGYQAANPLDLMFDNVTVSNLFVDDFNDGNYTGWTRIAGANNWTVQQRNPFDEPGSELWYTTSAGFSISTNYHLDLRIVSDASRYLDKVDLLLARVGVSPVYSLSVFADSNGVRTGTALAKTNFTATSTSYTWQSIDMPDIPLEQGKTYHVVATRESGNINSTNLARAYIIGPWNSNAIGRVVYSANNGSTWVTNYNYVPVFRIVSPDGSSQAQTYNSVSVVGSVANTRRGQKFTLPYAMGVTNIQALVYRSGTNVTSAAQVVIRRWSDKAALATSTVAAASIPTSASWVNFRISPTLNLGASTQYFYEVVNTAGVGNYYSYRANAYGGIYGLLSWHGTNDHAIYTTTAGTSWVNEVNYDLAFRLQGSGGRDNALRAWRIGNDENYLSAGVSTWSNVNVATDIKYCKQDYYFNDAELLLRYVDRNNYYKVGIRNFYGFWRLKYTVKVNGYSQQTGWLYEFPKTNRPAEGVWYNLRVNSQGSTNTVFFNGSQVGVFYATNHPRGKIALGSKAVQLGIWEPQKGYFFIDDDENGYSTDPYANGAPLNMDWGYLNQFYRTLVLPSVYVMNDAEASNMVRWITLGYNNIIATDGSVAMRNETGASDLGRVEQYFGVQPVVGSQASVSRVIIGTNDHYVTMDYTAGSSITASGAGKPWTTLSTSGVALATISNGTQSIGFIANTIKTNPDAPSKTFVFNYGIDANGQLTNGLKKVAQRAFEWARGQANKVRVELKYAANPTNPSLDIAVYTTNVWVLSGTGQTNVTVNVPSDGLMTGDGKFYWAVYTYPWDATNAWTEHNGFYSSGNDTLPLMSIAGKGLQILGATADAYAGRDWDVWAAYNTRTTTVTITYGIKEKGALQFEDNFDDGNFTGWTYTTGTQAYTSFTVANSQLQAQVISPYAQYATIKPSSLNITGKNITVEYDVLFTNGANEGGVMYRGLLLNVNPQVCGWADVYPANYTSNRPASNAWSHVVLNIRDGSPYLMSDLYVNGRPVFLSEPIEVSSFNVGENSVGLGAIFLGLTGTIRWDNVRVADEQYSLVWTNVMGEFVPNNPTNPTFWPAIPDYDPAMWEHDGSTLGAQYEWYLYARGENLHSYLGTRVYFAPRLQVELASFPTNLAAGTNVVVPVEWEQLPSSNLPARLRLRLFEAYSGAIYVEKTVTVSTVTGSTNIPVTINTMPAGTNYVWSAFIYPTNAINAWTERFGSDDTFRFNEAGIGLEPETMIRFNGAAASSGVYQVYSDAGAPVGASIYTWNGGAASFNGNYVDPTAPEGTMSFYTYGSYWQGWGVFKTATDLSQYSNGYLKFWVKSPVTVKVDLEGPQYTKRTQYIPSTTNVWVQKSIAISNFAGVSLTNMYGLFEATTESASTFYIDDVKWSLTP